MESSFLGLSVHLTPTKQRPLPSLDTRRKTSMIPKASFTTLVNNVSNNPIIAGVAPLAVSAAFGVAIKVFNLTKSYEVGHTIRTMVGTEIVEGVVKRKKDFTTEMTSKKGECLTIPNFSLVNPVSNITKQNQWPVEFKYQFSFKYDQDLVIARIKRVAEAEGVVDLVVEVVDIDFDKKSFTIGLSGYFIFDEKEKKVTSVANSGIHGISDAEFKQVWKEVLLHLLFKEHLVSYNEGKTGKDDIQQAWNKVLQLFQMYAQENVGADTKQASPNGGVTGYSDVPKDEEKAKEVPVNKTHQQAASQTNGMSEPDIQQASTTTKVDVTGSSLASKDDLLQENGRKEQVSDCKANEECSYEKQFKLKNALLNLKVLQSLKFMMDKNLRIIE